MTAPKPETHTVIVASPSKPRPDDPLTIAVADTLRRIENNYNREGSGPGSRFEGQLLEDVQARTAIAMVRSVQETRPAPEFAAATPAEARPEADWTVDPETGRANASPAFRRLVGEVDRLLRGGAGGVVLGESWTSGTAALVVAQLAHVHHLAPTAPLWAHVAATALREIAAFTDDTHVRDLASCALGEIGAAGTSAERQQS